MLRLLVHGLIALIITAWRRARSGPRRPSWSFGFEAMVTALRLHARWLARIDVAALRRATGGMRAPLAPGVSVRTESVRGVPVTWFEPATNVGSTILYLHGGGYVFGSADQDRGIASRIAGVLGARVVAPDYRLAPEHPFPAAVDDVVATYTGLLEAGHAPHMLVGLSSGAGLAVTTLARLRAAGVALPAGVVLLSPMLDLTGTSRSWSANAGVDWGIPRALRRWGALYAGSLDPSSPEVSPVHADLRGLPPMLVVNGDAELLADDASVFVERARSAGVPAIHHVERDGPHAFMALGRNDDATARVFEQMTAFAAARCARPQPIPAPHS